MSEVIENVSCVVTSNRTPEKLSWDTVCGVHQDVDLTLKAKDWKIITANCSFCYVIGPFLWRKGDLVKRKRVCWNPGRTSMNWTRVAVHICEFSGWEPGDLPLAVNRLIATSPAALDVKYRLRWQNLIDPFSNNANQPCKPLSPIWPEKHFEICHCKCLVKMPFTFYSPYIFVTVDLCPVSEVRLSREVKLTVTMSW